MEKRELFFEVRQVYGNTVFYPACAASKEALSALGFKTLTPAVQRALNALGFKLTAKTVEVKL